MKRWSAGEGGLPSFGACWKARGVGGNPGTYLNAGWNPAFLGVNGGGLGQCPYNRYNRYSLPLIVMVLISNSSLAYLIGPSIYDSPRYYATHTLLLRCEYTTIALYILLYQYNTPATIPRYLPNTCNGACSL
jgi:hypothetical protein